MSKRILFSGEVMGELRNSGGPDAGFDIGFAGDSFNAAVYCRRCLGQDAQVFYQTRIGHDPLSDGALNLAAREGLDTSLLHRDPNANLGLYAVQTDQSGERSFYYWRDQSAARRLYQDPAELDALGQADIAYLSGITLAIIAPSQRIAVLEKIDNLRLSCGITFAFDSNYRPTIWECPEVARDTLAKAWSITDIALPSVDDEMALFSDTDESSVLSRLRSYGLRRGALKRGGAGPVPLDPDLNVTAAFPPATTVVDTTAAGDSFNGAYLAALIQDLPPENCMIAGHNLARQVVGHPGAIIQQSRHHKLI